MKRTITFVSIAVMLTACKKEVVDVIPASTGSQTELLKAPKLTVTTTSVNVGSAYSVNANGSVSYSGGGSAIAERGFCYATTTNPTLSNDTVRAGSGVGNFSAGIAGLTAGTTYYVKAYAKSNTGDVTYGNQLSFTTLTLGMPSPGIGTVTDIDGNVYNTITLGTQVWMVENLKTTHYRDGTLIPNVTDNTTWGTLATGAYCDYDNNPANATAYGRLYNSYAATSSHNIAPAGWHVPSYAEWMTLFNYLGGGGVAGGRMKETGLTHWLAPNTAADNSSGFTAVGGGSRSATGTFSSLQANARWWSNSTSSFIAFYLSYDSGSYTYSLGSCPDCFKQGFSVRCVKD